VVLAAHDDHRTDLRKPLESSAERFDFRQSPEAPDRNPLGVRLLAFEHNKIVSLWRRDEGSNLKKVNGSGSVKLRELPDFEPSDREQDSLGGQLAKELKPIGLARLQPCEDKDQVCIKTVRV
jgi:hypothetical protein